MLAGLAVKTFRWDHSLGCKYKTFYGNKKGSSKVITLGQQYNAGEKPSVMLYTYINRHAGTPDKNKNKNKTIVVHN